MITFKNLGYAGRLGNQIFQYSMLYLLGKKLGYDIGLFESNEELRPGSMNLFTKQWVYTGLELHKVFDLTYNKLTDTSFIQSEFNEKQIFTYEDEIFNITDNTNIHGFFQVEKYFSSNRTELLNELKFNADIKEFCSNKISRYKDTVAIHVRRGDTLGHPGLMEVCTTEYYQKALELFTDKQYTYLVFSDDMQWCKDTFGEDDHLVYVDNTESDIPTHFLDLCLMSMCDHIILANSSFSWWAAWLNENKDKKVVCPLVPWNPLPTPEYYPQEWIKI